MRLTKIKLAGFKSFVDPASFHLPSNLVGIIGPNGCGKSNIIDAVRWVMGESSARHLRGESMADVIFNGSATRKPVGQASVELIFDNSHGRLGGPWAHYTELSIKRLVTRDGQSHYFLNGNRCRRRDITDIFLGTGLGPRSYAIIEQGTISRIIEAKPEELRTFFEEAAGISRYKERRRETETRIRHTRENLDRLTDLREELNHQLQHLQRQARIAEQYRHYKAEERRLKGELLALRWRTLSAEITAQETTVRDQENALEAILAEQRKMESRWERGRIQQANLTEEFTQSQQQYYAIGSEITRLEQYLGHQRELRQRQEKELQQTQQALDHVLAQIHLDKERITELECALREAEPAFEEVQAVEAEVVAQLEVMETAMQEWQAAWEGFNQRTGEAQRLAEVEGARIEQLERQLLNHERRLERLRLEREELAATDLLEELAALQQAEQTAEAELTAAQTQLVQIGSHFDQRQEKQRQLTAEINQLQECIQADHGRLSSLETLQEAALGRRGNAASQWLKELALEQAPRLAECLNVEPGWEQAAETVLGTHLEAVCVPDLEALATAVIDLERGGLRFFETKVDGSAPVVAQGLAGKIQALWPVNNLLAGVRVIDNVKQALNQRSALREGESFITPDGIWLGQNWMQVRRGDDEKTGMLIREREIQALRVNRERNAEALRQLNETLEVIYGELQDLECSRVEWQDRVNCGHREHAHLQGQVNALSVRVEQNLARCEALTEEQEELVYQAEQDGEALQLSRMRVEEALQSLEDLVAERQTLVEQRDTLRNAVQERRKQAQDARQTVQQQALAGEALRTGLLSTRQALQRLERQRDQLQARHGQLSGDVGPDEESQAAAQEQLEQLLDARIAAEKALDNVRQRVAAQDNELRGLEQARISREHRAQEVRQHLEEQRMALGEANVRRQILLDQLQELGILLDTVLASIPHDAEEALWQEQLTKLAGRIQRLGAVNLAAIEECVQLTERKQYLDAQNEDLVEALATLENAIRKIDRETRTRFRETFERVNNDLQKLFPRLFGGGQAYLELTGNDVLDAGVTIMARPPGKRIGNIHLLSGGEKALTAVALVFAIFQLNPAPFCMLDEVDAPLDEANVGRFGELVQEMSEHVQFIFITHNKGTMEIARHLSGVTMHEPGVSRLVAVDVDEAVRLAAV